MKSAPPTTPLPAAANPALAHPARAPSTQRTLLSANFGAGVVGAGARGVGRNLLSAGDRLRDLISPDALAGLVAAPAGWIPGIGIGAGAGGAKRDAGEKDAARAERVRRELEDVLAARPRSRRQEARMLERLVPDAAFRAQPAGFWEAHPVIQQRFPGGLVQFAQWAGQVPEDVLEDLFLAVGAAGEVQLRIADAITAFAGSMWFVYIHVVLFVAWMLFLERNPWPTLTLIVSLEAIFLSTFVMIGQNRQATFQQEKADHDFVTQEKELDENTVLTREIHRLTVELHALQKGRSTP